LHGSLYLEYVDNIADLEFQLPSPPVPPRDIFPGMGALVTEYIAAGGESDSQGCLETNLQNNPHSPYGTCKEYKYIHCGIPKTGMETYYDKVLQEKNQTLCFRSFKNGDGIQKLVARIPDDQVLCEWELHMLGDIR
jgi:hypothetical protein